jgi:hypothetical protein
MKQGNKPAAQIAMELNNRGRTTLNARRVSEPMAAGHPKELAKERERGFIRGASPIFRLRKRVGLSASRVSPIAQLDNGIGG